MKKTILFGVLAAMTLSLWACKGGAPPAEGAPTATTPAGLGKDFCARILKGDIEGSYNLMHPDMLAIVMKDSEANEPGAWKAAVDEQLETNKRDPVSLCEITNSTELDCSQETIDAFKAKYNVTVAKCGNIKIKVMKQSEQEGDAQENELPVLKIGDKWYLGGI